MRYLILIYENEATAPNDPAEMQRWFDYTSRLRASGSYLGGEALQPVATATTVRVRNGKVVTTDGPFAETKEQLGGFYMVDCKDLDEALKWAAEMPNAGRGSMIDRIRRARTFRRRTDVLEGLLAAEGANYAEPVALPDEDGTPHDDQLRLLFTCCHPALSLERQEQQRLFHREGAKDAKNGNGQ